jgi:ankyrin repeat protein
MRIALDLLDKAQHPLDNNRVIESHARLAAESRQRVLLEHQVRMDLHCAVANLGKSPEMTWQLLEKAKAVEARRIDPNEPRSVLETAIMDGDDDVINLVLKHQSFERCPRDRSLFLLKLSCVYDRMRSVEFLLRHLEEDVNVWIGEESLLTIAITSRSSGVVQFIVSDCRFSVDRTNTMRTLRSAIESVDRHDVRSECIEAALCLPGIDVNRSFEDGFTALTWIVQETAFKDVKRIESRFRELGIRMNNVTMERNFKQLQKNAREFLMTHTINILLGSGRVDANGRDGCGRTLLMELMKRGHQPPQALISLANLDWNVVDPDTLDTPLIVIARSKPGTQMHQLSDVLVRRLEIDVNVQNREGNTAAIEAVLAGNPGTFAAIAARDDCQLGVANRRGDTVMSISGCHCQDDANRQDIISAVVAAIRNRQRKPPPPVVTERRVHVSGIC